MPLNPAQQSAVNYLDGPLLVLAGPGTGKTQLLSSKVAHILKVTDTAPENILCLTFTESGASNMRTRLRSIIGPSAQKINIFTYHSFGTYLLGEYQNHFQSATRFFGEPLNPVAQYKILQNLQNQLPPLDPLKTAKIKDLIETIANLKNARLTTHHLEKIIADNQSSTHHLNQALDPLLQQIAPRMSFTLALPIYQNILQILLDEAKTKQSIQQIAPLALTLAHDLKNVFTKINPNKPSISPLTSWKNKTFIKDSNGHYQLAFGLAEKKLASLKSLLENYEQHLSQQSLFDFSDMIESTITALKEDSSFRLTCAERFQFILLDEFQDTNPAQFELIKLLTDYEQPQIMAVGDDDQAIFEFQGASASNLETFRQHYQAHVITLTENYRSTAEVLELSRHVAEKISDRFATQNNFQKVLSSFISQNHHPPCQISRHEFPSHDAEYHWVAEQIHTLIQNGTPPSEIAVIAPKHKYLSPLLPYFKKYQDLPISYEKRDNLLTDPLIQQITLLSQLIYQLSQNKTPSLPLLHLLSFDFWQLSPNIAISFAHHADKKQPLLDLLTTADHPVIQQIGHFLAHLTTQSFQLDFNSLLKELITPQILDFYTENQNNHVKLFNFYEKLLVVTQKLTEYSKSTNPKLPDFLEFVADYQLADQPLLNTSPYQNSANAVQLLSAHKSKGLEFQHVFLISVDNLSWGGAKGNNNQLVLPPNLASIRHTGTNEDERLRLFFVAITRAKTHLVMTNSLSDFTGKTPDRLAYLDEFTEKTPDDQTVIKSPFIPGQTVNFHPADLPSADRCTDLQLAWCDHYQDPEPEITKLLLQKLQNYRLSASDLTSFIDIIYAGPQNFYQTRILSSLATPLTSSQIYGTAIHRTLEHLTNHHSSLPELTDFYLATLHSLTQDENFLQELSTKGQVTLPIIFNHHQALLTNSFAHAEVNFRHQNLHLDSVPLTGTIDHLQIDPTQKTIQIYDFKTTKRPHQSWYAHPANYKYLLQLNFYKILLELSPKYRDYQITDGHILFLTPDHNQSLASLSYQFPTADQNLTRSLIFATYQQITSLDFLTQTDLFLPPDKNKTIKQLKAFIELLISSTQIPSLNQS